MNPLPILQFLAGPIGRWLVLGLLLAATIAAAGIKGYNAGYAANEAEYGREVAAANDRARAAERDGRERLAALATRHYQEETHARIENDRLRADLRSGTRRLSIAIAQPPACADRAAAAESGAEARAELNPAAAEALVAITDDGDAAIRQANALIDAYAIAQRVCGK